LMPEKVVIFSITIRKQEMTWTMTMSFLDRLR
jgi:hypothetical protein